ncbi:hypothetical protein [Paenibacillus popilliae]|uniref:hypothetical protein n=1 Tax=Paenibacillus popilliae TaxID=78057 RepID=UPI001F361387|nr:hypothetical protein [Paenibacillus popilliae]
MIINRFIYYENTKLTQLLGRLALIVILFEGGMRTSWKQMRSVVVQPSLSTIGVVATALVFGLSVSPLGAHPLAGRRCRLYTRSPKNLDMGTACSQSRPGRAAALSGTGKWMLRYHSKRHDPAYINKKATLDRCFRKDYRYEVFFSDFKGRATSQRCR